MGTIFISLTPEHPSSVIVYHQFDHLLKFLNLPATIPYSLAMGMSFANTKLTRWAVRWHVAPTATTHAVTINISIKHMKPVTSQYIHVEIQYLAHKNSHAIKPSHPAHGPVSQGSL
jgi:hypothetical protein